MRTDEEEGIQVNFPSNLDRMNENLDRIDRNYRELEGERLNEGKKEMLRISQFR